MVGKRSHITFEILVNKGFQHVRRLGIIGGHCSLYRDICRRRENEGRTGSDHLKWFVNYQ